MSSGPSYWLTKTTWILYKDFVALNTIPIWDPMSCLNMALLSIMLTVARIVSVGMVDELPGKLL